MKYIIIALALLQSCVADKPITITAFTTYNKPVDTTVSLGKEMIYYNNFFLVSNYRNNQRVERKVDSFVVGFIAANKYSANTNEIRFYFYKETRRTNLVDIERNPREIDRYSNQHDLVYYYAVKSNGNTVREKFKNGQVIETTAKKVKMPKFKIIQH